MANIVLNTKTYTGSGIINAIATWVERSGGVAAAFSYLTASLRITDKSRGKWKLSYPIVATVDTASAAIGDLLRTADVEISWRIDPGFTAAERTDFGLRVKDLAAHSEFQNMITNLIQPTG